MENTVNKGKRPMNNTKKCNKAHKQQQKLAE